MKQPDKIALGITEDEVPLGSHLVHFWRTDEEFERGVRFLQLGIANESDYCVLYGHDEGNERVLEILRNTRSDLDRVLREGRLVIFRREDSAPVALAKIEDAFSSAARKGARAIRCLGNLGMGRDPLPGRGADEVIDIETGATALALRYPCVTVCMYDVNTVSGHLLLNAGFGTHPLTVWKDVLQQSPHCPTPKSAGA
jgi:MEDS: MEthanogen/methylotroph, DcmR Sensory domain